MSAYRLPPLPARPLPKLPELTIYLSESRMVMFHESQQEDALADAMRVEIEQRFEEVLNGPE